MSETVETTMRHGISGQFLDNRPGFSEISRLFAELSLACNKLRDIEARLRNCNHPIWLPSFEKRCQRLRRDDKKEFIFLVHQLEARKTGLEATVNETRAKLLHLEPTALDTRETLSGSSSVFDVLPARRRMKDPDVAVRNLVIARHPDESDKAICDLLDIEFPSYDRRPAAGLPDSWVTEFGVLTYRAAYQKCRQRVHTLISKVRNNRHLP